MSSGVAATQSPYKNTLGWNLGFSAYWFATSYKWFILLFILLPTRARELGDANNPNSSWGLVLGIGAIIVTLGPPISGRLCETLGGIWGRHGLWLMMGATITAVGAFTVYGATTYGALIIGFLLLQIGDSIATGPYAGMVATTVPSENRGFASSVLGGLKLFGQIASAIVAILFSKHAIIIYGAVAGLNLICAAWTTYTIRHVPHATVDAEHVKTNFFTDWVAPFKQNDFLFVWLNRFVVALAFAMVSAFALNFLKFAVPSYHLFGKDLGKAETAAQAIALTISLAGVFGSIYTARVADRIGRKRLLVISGAMVFVVLFPIGFIRDFTLIWLLVFGFGLGNGIYAAADWALVSDILPNIKRAGTDMGVWHSAETVVQLMVAPIGFAIDALNHANAGSGYVGMCIGSACLFLLSTVFVRNIKGAR